MGIKILCMKGRHLQSRDLAKNDCAHLGPEFIQKNLSISFHETDGIPIRAI